MNPLTSSLLVILVSVASLHGAACQGFVEAGNIAVGRILVAGSTCGLQAPEQFCPISSATGAADECFVCEASSPATAHNASALSDGNSSTWWQAEAGRESVTVELRLETPFSFSHLVLQFRSLRPGAAIISKSSNFGRSYQVLQYYSKDCQMDFGLPDQSVPVRLDQVVCSSEFSSPLPLSGGELVYRALPPSLGPFNLSDPAVQERTTLTNLRLHFLRFNLFPRDDLSQPATRRKYYHSLSEVLVSGWCFCGGVVQRCGPAPGAEPGMVNSVCQCDSGYFFVDNECRACRCDVSGSLGPECELATGRCACKPGVGGTKCDTCLPRYYGFSANGCEACNCSLSGSLGAECSPEAGQCACSAGFAGQRCQLCSNGTTGAACDECLSGFFRAGPSCEPCACHPDGTVDGATTCDPASGQCPCVGGVSGRRCDACPAGSVGPSAMTASPCLACFCDGLSATCVPAAGWRQTFVRDSFRSGEGTRGFTSTGPIQLQSDASGTSLSASPRPGSNALSLFFPEAYMGDRRTAFSQTLSLDLRVSRGLGDGCRLTVVIRSQLSFFKQARLRLPLDCPPTSTSPTHFEVRLGEGQAMLDLGFYRRTAIDTDFRRLLANIVTLELEVVFQRSSGSESISLVSAQLGLAISGPSPLPPVLYVEQCSCRPNRQGQFCGECAPGYTFDPAFGGEFALCVRCFCNFHSEMCHPVSGICTGCRDNTTGDDCEQCEEGFYRDSPLTLDGCLPCDCFPRGTVGGVCRNETCECLPGFTGARCAACEVGLTGVLCELCERNTTGLYPSCAACNQCSGDWWLRIEPLRAEINATIQFLRSLNGSNITVNLTDSAELTALFALIEEIDRLLAGSGAAPLAANIEALHGLLCRLLNQTERLLQRARAVEETLGRLEGNATETSASLERLALTLANLSRQLEAVRLALRTLVPVEPGPALLLAREAQARADNASIIVESEVSPQLSATTGVLEEFYTKLNESQFEERHREIVAVLDTLAANLTAYHELIVMATNRLCGGGNDSCEGCGGVECEGCGGGGCGGLVAESEAAVNVSSRAVRLARKALAAIGPQLEALRSLADQSGAVLSDAEAVEEQVNATAITAELLSQLLTSSVDMVAEELGLTRIDPDLIRELENRTLSLHHNLTLDQFFSLLLDINKTIDQFFEREGVNETELRRRAEEALANAEAADGLAAVVVRNSSVLEEELNLLINRSEAANNQRVVLNRRLNDIEELNMQADDLLQQTLVSLAASQAELAGLQGRLSVLGLQVEENERGLAQAAARSERARQLSLQADEGTADLEADFELVSNSSATKFQQSQADLEQASNIRNQTNTLLTRAQEQLLLVEFLGRREQALRLEQQVIRADIQRVANELESLDLALAQRITRNTACLDTVISGKK